MSDVLDKCFTWFITIHWCNYTKYIISVRILYVQRDYFFIRASSMENCGLPSIRRGVLKNYLESEKSRHEFYFLTVRIGFVYTSHAILSYFYIFSWDHIIISYRGGVHPDWSIAHIIDLNICINDGIHFMIQPVWFGRRSGKLNVNRTTRTFKIIHTFFSRSLVVFNYTRDTALSVPIVSA